MVFMNILLISLCFFKKSVLKKINVSLAAENVDPSPVWRAHEPWIPVCFPVGDTCTASAWRT